MHTYYKALLLYLRGISIVIVIASIGMLSLVSADMMFDIGWGMGEWKSIAVCGFVLGLCYGLYRFFSFVQREFLTKY
jgi:hypothetical protein